ncbi:MAG: hypothetical protein A2309_02870 [Bacteroidetes bacterium RIFOXYB2_FULL_35_7]|nr:MAG: hypothetical protein A2309_02870 [Bacteroidetes bacterium RIFOXYB2_FULL_35_7]
MFLFLAVVILTGCQTAQAPTSSVEKRTSFMGITLGMSKSEVQGILGTAIYIGENDSFYIYSYGASTDKAIFYAKPEIKASIILTAGTGYSIDKISVGNTSSYVEQIEGVAEEIQSDTTYYYYLYPSKNLYFCFYKTNDILATLGIYDPKKAVFTASISYY